jgi:hypothetical protein
MTVTLDQIHADPTIIDRAIGLSERLDIHAAGMLKATLLPAEAPSIEKARETMRERFERPDWQFGVGQPMNREERNSRG